jgi:uncharacterized protein (DUF58 family)
MALLDADAAARAEALGLAARQIVEGFKVGDHRSPLRGFAIEFAQHREYAPGDDMRHLDWKVLARSDRHYIKQYEQDTNFVAQLVVDGSESMAFGSGSGTKFFYATSLAACIAYAILQQRDAVGCRIIDAGTREVFPRTDNPGRMDVLLHLLARFEPTGPTDLGAGLEEVASSMSGRGIAIVFSDCFAPLDTLRRGIERLRFAGHEVILFHILDPAEIRFELSGTYQFDGLENSGQIKVCPADLRKGYLEAFGRFLDGVRAICDTTDCHYVQADTSHALAEIVGRYLAFRRNLGR